MRPGANKLLPVLLCICLLSLCAICTSTQGGRPAEITDGVRSRFDGVGLTLPSRFGVGGTRNSPVEVVTVLTVPTLELL